MSKKVAKAAQFDWMKIPQIRNALTPATGTGKFHVRSAKTIRLCKKGCTNRPFYQIVVMEVINCFWMLIITLITSILFSVVQINLIQ